MKKANMLILVSENGFSWILLVVCFDGKARYLIRYTNLRTYFVIKNMEIRRDVKMLSLKTHLNAEFLHEPTQRMQLSLHRSIKVLVLTLVVSKSLKACFQPSLSRLVLYCWKENSIKLSSRTERQLETQPCPRSIPDCLHSNLVQYANHYATELFDRSI